MMASHSWGYYIGMRLCAHEVTAEAESDVVSTDREE